MLAERRIFPEAEFYPEHGHDTGWQAGIYSHGKPHAGVTEHANDVGQGPAGRSGQPADGTGVHFAAVAHPEPANDVDQDLGVSVEQLALGTPEDDDNFHVAVSLPL